MTPEERADIARGLDVLGNIVKNVATSPLAPLLPTSAQPFVEIASESIELAKELVAAGHADPASELRRLRTSIQEAWQTALDKKFSGR